MVVLTPSFGITQAEIRSKLANANIQLSAKSTLIIDGSDITIKKLTLDETLIVKAKEGETVVLADSVVKNKGWTLKPIAKGQTVDEQFVIRGYTIERTEQHLADASSNSPRSVTTNDARSSLRR